MSANHKNLSVQRWQNIPFFGQMANIGAEIGRSINWRVKNKEMSLVAFERGLELLDLTIEDPKNKVYLKEICRLREVLADYFVFDNTYHSSDQAWNNYFYGFNYATAVKAGR